MSEEQRTVKDTVRRTEVDVEKGGADRRFGAAATSTPDIQKADITDKASPKLGRSTEPDIDMAAAQRATAAIGEKPELAPKGSAPRIVKDPSQGPPVPGKPGPSPMPEPVPIEGASRAAAGDMPPEHQHADLYDEKLARDPQYHGKAWETIEPAARHQWTSEHKGTWEEFKERIRNAWERISSH